MFNRVTCSLPEPKNTKPSKKIGQKKILPECSVCIKKNFKTKIFKISHKKFLGIFLATTPNFLLSKFSKFHKKMFFFGHAPSIFFPPASQARQAALPNSTNRYFTTYVCQFCEQVSTLNFLETTTLASSAGGRVQTHPPFPRCVLFYHE